MRITVTVSRRCAGGIAVSLEEPRGRAASRQKNPLLPRFYSAIVGRLGGSGGDVPKRARLRAALCLSVVASVYGMSASAESGPAGDGDCVPGDVASFNDPSDPGPSETESVTDTTGRPIGTLATGERPVGLATGGVAADQRPEMNISSASLSPLATQNEPSRDERRRHYEAEWERQRDSASPTVEGANEGSRVHATISLLRVVDLEMVEELRREYNLHVEQIVHGYAGRSNFFVGGISTEGGGVDFADIRASYRSVARVAAEQAQVLALKGGGSSAEATSRDAKERARTDNVPVIGFVSTGKQADVERLAEEHDFIVDASQFGCPADVIVPRMAIERWLAGAASSGPAEPGEAPRRHKTTHDGEPS